ncbi:MAG: methyltransferase domain-containing protein [Sphingomonadales bacterium]|nr:methyltransferase domain-containing protein [Sphingomonadales bacterium]
MPKPDASYFDGINEKLLLAIPSDAVNIIEFGCANGRLGAAFKSRHPAARWTGIDVNDDAIQVARQHLDAVFKIDLNGTHVPELRGDYDCIVFGDLLEHLADPESFLDGLASIGNPDTRLVCCIPNMCHASVIERMLAGDMSYDENGLLDATHLRFLSPASVFKMLLDSGWLPGIVDQYVVGHAKNYVDSLVQAGATLGIPTNTTLKHVLAYQLIIDCRKSRRAKAPPDPGVKLSVVVPVNNTQQFSLNVGRSPGLKEIDAQILPVQGAANPAEALDFGGKHTDSEWLLFCHQDVYVPKGSGKLMQELLSSIPADKRRSTLIAFAGLLGGEAVNASTQRGLVIDRTSRFDHEAGLSPVSVDEFAIVVSRDSIHRIDGSIGWHAWATDLCLASARRGDDAEIIVARVPMFHNSYNDSVLPAEFFSSIRRIFGKYPELSRIQTLNGDFLRESAAAP